MSKKKFTSLIKHVSQPVTAEGTYWAPESVVGFVDNRPQGPNGDYAVHLDDVRSGLNGRQLADRLITI